MAKLTFSSNDSEFFRNCYYHSFYIHLYIIDDIINTYIKDLKKKFKNYGKY